MIGKVSIILFIAIVLLSHAEETTESNPTKFYLLNSLRKGMTLGDVILIDREEECCSCVEGGYKGIKVDTTVVDSGVVISRYNMTGIVYYCKNKVSHTWALLELIKSNEKYELINWCFSDTLSPMNGHEFYKLCDENNP